MDRTKHYQSVADLADSLFEPELAAEIRKQIAKLQEACETRKAVREFCDEFMAGNEKRPDTPKK